MNIILKPGHEFDYGLWYYLAGPMTGLPEYNYPAFEKAVSALEEAGIPVKSPHTIDHRQHEFTNPPGYFSPSCTRMMTFIDADGREYGGDCGERPDHPIHSLALGALPYATYMKAGYRMLLNCDGIILLHGWSQSKGTNHELHVARSLGYPIYTLGQNLEFLMELDEGDH